MVLTINYIKYKSEYILAHIYNNNQNHANLSINPNPFAITPSLSHFPVFAFCHIDEFVFIYTEYKSSCNARNLGLIRGSERSPGEGNGYPLQYSCLENLMDRGAWRATVHGVPKSWTRLSD